MNTDTFDHAIDSTSATLKDAAQQTRKTVKAQVDQLTDKLAQGRDWAGDALATANEETAAYVQRKPLRSLMMAAAVGMIVVAVVNVAFGDSARQAARKAGRRWN